MHIAKWLKQDLPATCDPISPSRRKAYGFFLHSVALLPYTLEQLLAMATQDFDRVLAMEAYEQQRDLGAPDLKLAASSEEEVAHVSR